MVTRFKAFTCETCGTRFERRRNGGPTPKYCSDGCRRTGDREKHRKDYVPADRKRELASEAEAGYWLPDPDVPWEPSAQFVDLRSGTDRPNRRTAVTAALMAELDRNGFNWVDSNLDAGLRPEDYDERSRQLYSDPEYAQWSPEVDRELVRSNAGMPDDSLSFGGPWIHREPGWIPIDEWFAQQPDDDRAWRNGRGVDPADIV